MAMRVVVACCAVDSDLPIRVHRGGNGCLRILAGAQIVNAAHAVVASAACRNEQVSRLRPLLSACALASLLLNGATAAAEEGMRRLITLARPQPAPTHARTSFRMATTSRRLVQARRPPARCALFHSS